MTIASRLAPKTSAWVACLLAAALARILPAAIHFVIGTDEALYLTLARNLAAGLGFTADGATPHTEFAPMYPILASLVYRFGGGPDLPAQLNILIFGSLLVVPVWGLAKDMAMEYKATPHVESLPTSVALKAAALTALLPALVLSVPNWEAPTEQIYMVLLWAGWWAGWRALKRPGIVYGALAGLLLGLAHVTRIEGLYYVAVGGALLVGRAIVEGALHRGSKLYPRFVTAIAFALAASVCVLPYSLYVYMNTGLWLAPKGILHQYHGEALLNDDPLAFEATYTTYEENLRNLRALPSIPAYFWEHRVELPGIYARNTIREIVQAFKSPVFMPVVWLPLALIGLWRLRGDRGARWPTIFLALSFGPALLYHPLTVVDLRYLLPMLPAAMIWAAVGLTPATALQPRFGIGNLDFAYFSRAVPGILLLLFIAADLTGPFLIPRPVEYKTMGEWMQANGTARGETILARKRQVAFYAGAQWEWLPFADLDGVLTYASDHHARYIVIDERTAPTLRPQLAFLLNATQAPSSLKLIHIEEGEKRVMLYAVNP